MISKYDLIRFLLRTANTLLREKSYEFDRGASTISPRLEGPLQEEVVKAFQTVFSEPPWYENWAKDDVLGKMNRELTGNSFIVVLRGNADSPVAGFCWGGILNVGELEEHITPALGARPVGLQNALMRVAGDDRILYFHEFAILRAFRGGVEPLRLLLLPSLQFGWTQGVKRTLFWTTPASRIFPLSLYMGYEPIWKTESKGKDIFFMYHPNFAVFLRIIQRINGPSVAKIVRLNSRLFSRRMRGLTGEG